MCRSCRGPGFRCHVAGGLGQICLGLAPGNETRRLRRRDPLNGRVLLPITVLIAQYHWPVSAY